MEQISIALNICTYKRNEYVIRIVNELQNSKFFDPNELAFYKRLQIFIVDNASELCNDLFENIDFECIHLIHNKNSGGSGGFQRGLEEIRRANSFSHIIFMDDDVCFDVNSFYILYDFLRNCTEDDLLRPVAGRMFCLDKPNIQYTAAEIWNAGNIKHIEYMRDTIVEPVETGRVNYDSGAEYGGWWFCCYPMSFAGKNDIIPFFIHCDDVEYGLRCGKSPIIIEGVHVWHETFDKRMSPIMQYYDTRNPLFVNQIHKIEPTKKEIYEQWKTKITSLHLKKDWLSEYYVIRAMDDFLKGLDWLYKIDSGDYHEKLKKASTTKLKNALMWRLVSMRFKKYEK